MRVFSWAWLLSAWFGATWLCLSNGIRGQASVPSAERIDELIRELGSRSFKVREAAEQKLSGIDAAVPALRQALPSADLEVARRAARILRVIDLRQTPAATERLKLFAENGEIDRLAEGMVYWRAGELDGCWQHATGFAAKLVSAAARAGTCPRFFPALRAPIGDFAGYKKLNHPIESKTGSASFMDEGAFLIRAEEIALEFNTYKSLLVCSGTCRARQVVYASVIFAGGPVSVGEAFHSVIVCDGNFHADFMVENCIIIARGLVSAEWIAGSFIVTSDRVVDNGRHRDSGNVIKEKDAALGGLVKFFETSQAGIDVEPAAEGVRVVKLTENKAFAQSGLRIGDVLLALDDVPIRSPDSFRRMLRGKLAQQNPISFRVRRATEVLKLVVRCKD